MSKPSTRTTNTPATLALSGGKDSVATLLDARDRWNLRLAVTVKHEFADPIALSNALKACSETGVRHQIVEIKLAGWFKRALKEGAPLCTKCGRAIIKTVCLVAKSEGFGTVLTGHELRGKFGRRTVYPYSGVTVVRYPALRRWTWEDIKGKLEGADWFDPNYTCPIRPYGVHRFVEEVGYNPLTGRAATILLEGIATPEDILDYLRETETPPTDPGPEDVAEALGADIDELFPNGPPDGPRPENHRIRDLTYRLLMYYRQYLRGLSSLNRIEREERGWQLRRVLTEWSDYDDRIEELNPKDPVRVAYGEKDPSDVLPDVEDVMARVAEEYDREVPGVPVPPKGEDHG